MADRSNQASYCPEKVKRIILSEMVVTMASISMPVDTKTAFEKLK